MKVEDFFDVEEIEAGTTLIALGHLEDFVIRKEKGGFTVSGKVLDEASKYRPYISIGCNGEVIESLRGSCSCSKGKECRHIAALCIQFLKKQNSAWYQWVKDLQEEKCLEKSKEDHKEVIVYLLSENVRWGKDVVQVIPSMCKILKQGGYGKARAIAEDSHRWEKWATKLDAQILLQLKQKRLSDYSPDDYFLDPQACGDVFESIISSERAFWKESSIPLKKGEERKLNVKWDLCKDGLQRLKVDAQGGRLLPIFPPWYVDEKKSLCGPITVDFPDHYYLALAKAPRLLPHEVKDFRNVLEEGKIGIPLPTEYEVKEKKEIPRIHIDLIGEEIDQYWRYASKKEPLILPCVVYGNRKIPYNHTDQILFQEEGGKVIAMKRNHELEKMLIESLKKDKDVNRASEVYGSSTRKYADVFTVGRKSWSDDRKLAALKELGRVWKKRGWSMQIEKGFPLQWIEESGQWYVDLEEDTKDWFDLELGIEMEGKKINLLPIITQILDNSSKDLREFEGPILINLPDGRSLKLPLKRMRAIASILRELHDPKMLLEKKLKLPRLRCAEIFKTAKDFDLELRGTEELRKLGENLQKFKGITPIELPKKFRATLRPYQKEGFNWLQFLSEHKVGGILADDMGLGKTVQALAHITKEKEKGIKKPSLVIAPRSLMTNWLQEIERFAPHLKVLPLYGPKRKESFARINKVDIVLTSYPLVMRDHKELTKHTYHTIVFDEAQMIKNPQAKSSKICRGLSGDHRICLTGTPMENHLGELWSLFDCINPGLLGTLRQFNWMLRNPIEKQGDKKAQKTLTNRTAPFMMRRTKDVVARELPLKTEIIQSIELQGDQRDLYESIRLSVHQKVNEVLESKGIASSQIVILDALLKLRQACCDPSLLKLKNAQDVKESAKLSFLKEMLEDLLSQKRKILLFSSFTSMLAIIEKELIRKKIPYSKLTGATKDRDTPIKKFQDGESLIFLISLKAGGVGLNLTAADTVIHYDPWWNPAAENQATDRAHRIGQEKPIFVYKLITKDSVEEKILKMQERKKSLIDGILSQNQKKHSSLTLEDLKYLFEPLDKTMQTV